jgi:hypothetical protein
MTMTSHRSSAARARMTSAVGPRRIDDLGRLQIEPCLLQILAG